MLMTFPAVKWQLQKANARQTRDILDDLLVSSYMAGRIIKVAIEYSVRWELGHRGAKELPR